MTIKNLLQKQELRFLFVGGLNTLVGYGIYAILLYFKVDYLIANTISTILGVAHSYLWNRFFTFKSKEKAGKELIKFISVYVISYLLGMFTLFIMKSKFNIDPYIAGFINLGITTIISWFGHKYFSFNKEKINLKSLMKKNIKYIIPFLLFIVCFGLLLMYKNIPDFTDEGDAMLGAMMIINNKVIYTGFASQHLPFTYFILAPFAFFGVNSVVGFRISMYLILSLIWIFMYVRYQKHFGILPMILYPLLYILYMSFPSYLSATVISEQFQSQCLVILLLELLLFMKQKKLSLSSKIVIPTVMVVAIGTAFVSIIPCFIAVIIFLFVDIKNYCSKQKFTIGNYLKHFWKQYKIILIVGFSLIGIFVLYLYFTGSLEECYKQAFYLNTDIYSKYNNYSSNPIVTIIKIIPNYLLSIANAAHLNFKSLLYLLLYGGVFVLIFKIVKKDFMYAILLLLFITLCGNRNFTDFHALPYFAVSIMCLSLVISTLNKKYVFLVLLLLSAIFLKQTSSYISTINQTRVLDTEYYQFIDLLTKEGNMLHIDISTPEYLNENKLPFNRFASMVPWYAEIYGTEYLELIQSSNAPILSYNPNDTVWNYAFKDFIPEVNDYILKNYVYLNYRNLWVKKDFIKDAEKKANKDFAEYNNNFYKKTSFSLNNNYLEQIIIPEENTNKFGIKFETFNRSNYSLLHVQILESEKEVYSKTISTHELINNGYYIFDLQEKKLEKNKEYVLKISSEFTNQNDFVAVYKVEDEFNLDKNYLKINGIKYNEDLVMEMYYE